MKKKDILKRVIAIIIVVVMVLALVIPVFAEETSTFTCNRNIVNFSKVLQRQSVRPQVLTITNNTDSVTTLAWKLLDPYGLFDVEFMQSPNGLQAHGSLDVLITVTDTSILGNYSALLVCYDVNNVSKYVSIPIYMDVLSNVKESVSELFIRPSTSKISVGAHANMKAMDDLFKTYPRSVNWRIDGQSSPTTYISTSGDIYVSPDEKSQVIHVTATDVKYSTEATIDINIISNAYTVSVSTEPLNGGIIKGSGIYLKGSPVTIEAIAFPGFVFDHWIDENNQPVPERVIKIDSISDNLDYTAVFNYVYNAANAISYDNRYGVIEGTKRDAESITATASENKGYEFYCWCDAYSIVSHNRTYTSHKDDTVVAFFKKKDPYVYAYCFPSDSGKVSINSEGKMYNISVQPNDEYIFDGIYIDDILVSKELTYSTEPTQDMCAIAKFHKKGEDEIKVFSGNYGSYISTTTFCANTMSLISTVPYRGYYIAGRYCDYQSLPNDTFLCEPSDSVIVITDTIKDPVLKPTKFTQITNNEQLAKQQARLDSSDVLIKSDLGISDVPLTVNEYEALDSSGILSYLGFDISDVDDSKHDLELLKMAYMRNYLYVNSNFTKDASTQYTTVLETVDALLTHDERLALYSGDRVMCYLMVLPNNYKIFDLGQSYSDYIVSQYYNCYLIKIINGDINFIDMCAEPVQIQVDLPDTQDYKLFAKAGDIVEPLSNVSTVSGIYAVNTRYITDLALGYLSTATATSLPEERIKTITSDFLSTENIHLEYLPVVILLFLLILLVRNRD